MNDKEMMSRILVRASALLAILAFTTGSAFAADFPQRQAAEALAARDGLGMTQLPVLERLAGPGRVAVAESLEGRLSAGTSIRLAGRSTEEDNGKRLLRSDESGAQLRIYGDGTKVKYRNYPLLFARLDLARPVAERISSQRLETLGRQFISETLEGLVELGENEELVPQFTEFAIGGNAEIDNPDPKATEQVFASTVIFTRRVGGVPVIGPGSKIAVLFANDEVPVGFDLDWSNYRATGEAQEILPLEGILDRSRLLAGKPLTDTAVERFECGYFDGGARRGDSSAPIQAGCAVHFVTSRVSEFEGEEITARSAQTEVIPGGATVLTDEDWPEALEILGHSLPEDGVDPGPNPSRTSR